MLPILSRIYSLFQQNIYTKNNTWTGKSADTAKASSNFENKNRKYYSNKNFRTCH